MMFWWRELSGWLLVGLGMGCFAVVWHFCRNRWLLEAVPMTFIGLVVFWGGIQLLKVAMAARICQQAQEQLSPTGRKPNPASAPRQQG